MTDLLQGKIYLLQEEILDLCFDTDLKLILQHVQEFGNAINRHGVMLLD